MTAFPGLKWMYPQGLICNFNSAGGIVIGDPVLAAGKELCLVKLDQGWEVSESAMSSILANPSFDFTK
jgi:hypothetical protein